MAPSSFRKQLLIVALLLSIVLKAIESHAGTVVVQTTNGERTVSSDGELVPAAARGSSIALLRKKKGPPPVSPAVCRPGVGVDAKKCAAKIAGCSALGIRMKFKASNCVAPDGTRYHDAGCQCGGYCAYNCRPICNGDSDCYWNGTANACFVKATQRQGFPIDDCAHPPISNCAATPRETFCGGDQCEDLGTCYTGQDPGYEGICFRLFENPSLGGCGGNFDCDAAANCTATSQCPTNHICVESCCDTTYATGKCVQTCTNGFL